jgi:hypothetical protein
MAAEISLYLDSERTELVPLVHLHSVIAPEIFSDLIEGAPLHVFGRNTGTTQLRNLRLGLSGEHMRSVQLARDEGGSPGVWAAPGESIVVNSETVYVDGDFDFWARGVYNPTDAEGLSEFMFVFQALSVGSSIV